MSNKKDKETFKKELIAENDIKENSQYNFARTLYEMIDSLDEIATQIHSSTKKSLTTDQLANLLSTPEKNTDKLQDLMHIAKEIDGMIREIITYKANILTYDHFIFTLNATKYKDKEKLVKAYIKCAERLEMYNLKLNLPWIMEDVISDGEIYLYIKRDKTGILFQKLPNKLCKICRVVKGVQKYAFKLDGITNDTLSYYPDEIQKLYKRYKNGSLKNDKNFLDGNYYILDSENAVAFSITYMQSKNPPYYLSLLRNLATLEDLKDIQNANTLLDNFKLIVQKVPTDDDGNMLLEKNVITMYHKALKKVLPSLAGAVTTPLEITNVNLGNISSNVNDYITKVTEDFYNNAGVNSDIFNSASKTNTQVAIYGAIVDTLLPLNILRQIEVWVNYDMQNMNETKNFGLKFVDSTNFNKTEKVKNAINFLATWNSRLELLALMGHTPLTAINILYMEQTLDIDTVMPNKLTAYTASSKDEENNDVKEKDEQDQEGEEEEEEVVQKQSTKKKGIPGQGRTPNVDNNDKNIDVGEENDT